MKKMVIQCGQCKTQTADYFFHHANVSMKTIFPLFSIPKNNSPQSALLQCSNVVARSVYSPKNVSTHNSVNL